ncbi:hypothetical protein C8R45DRAFT_1213451 [Mycena sanguinolenta]|nr:hypothetical protein C8R45DRAFT_1213451 [Mycena sanguinolenta]
MFRRRRERSPTADAKDVDQDTHKSGHSSVGSSYPTISISEYSPSPENLRTTRKRLLSEAERERSPAADVMDVDEDTHKSGQLSAGSSYPTFISIPEYSPPSKTSHKRLRSEVERRLELESDPNVKALWPHEVVCMCGATIELDKRWKYYPAMWRGHRKFCKAVREGLEHSAARSDQGLP